MTVEQETLDAVRELILEHRGKENAIFASEIAEEVGIEDGDTTVNTREYITELLEEGIPLASNPGLGYWVIETQEELDNYVGSLERRARSIENRKLKALDAAESWPELELTDEDHF